MKNYLRNLSNWDYFKVRFLKETALSEKTFKIITKSAKETQKLGKKLASLLKPDDVLSLTGDLGAGKTCFTQGIALGLGIKRRITSPTFNLIKEYKTTFPLYHFDVYRINSLEEMEDLGYEEYFFGKGVTVIEWGDKIAPLLPPDHLEIEFKRLLKENEREIYFIVHGKNWTKRLIPFLSSIL